MQAGERELIEASRRGDRGAFAQIIERYQRAVYAVAFSGTRDRALADDVAQDAFVIAWRKLAELRDAARLPAWLCGIARNLARDARKRMRREVHDDTDIAIDPTTPFRALSQAESDRIVADALGQVPDVYREPLVLYYYEERSVADVARCLGITPATTNKRLSRGRRYLAERVALVESGVTRRGASATLAASVLAIIGITVPAAHVDASTVQKGSTMHKLAIAATVAATVSAGGILVATATRSSDAHASSKAQNAASASTSAGDHSHAHAGAACAHGAAASAPSLPALLAAHRNRTAAAALPANDCTTVGAHLADLEAGTGHAEDPTRCASDYASVCETEAWSLERRVCVLAADDLLNAHLCAVQSSSTPSNGDESPAVACSAVAAHVAPIVQTAGLYPDVPDFAQQIEAACVNGQWSVALRQCFVAGQDVDALHACMQPAS